MSGAGPIGSRSTPSATAKPARAVEFGRLGRGGPPTGRAAHPRAKGRSIVRRSSRDHSTTALAQPLLVFGLVHLVNLPSDPFDVFITRDPIVRRIVEQLRSWSRDAAEGLISGEPGVGKTLAARVLHMASSSALAPLVVCSSAEAHGVADGWATLRERGGTLVLDALERWSLDEQGAVVTRLRALTTMGPAIRVLGASRVSLSRLQLEARLHPALNRRWANRVVHMPPLRTRPDDLAPLVQVMLRRAGRASVHLSPGAWRSLATHGWPDNVRELRQVIDATLARSADEHLDTRHLALDPLAPPALEAMADHSFDAVRREVDCWYLRRLLHQTGGNLSEAARRAGCSRKVLRDRLRRHGLYSPPVRSTPASLPSIAREPVTYLAVAPPASRSGVVAQERIIVRGPWGRWTRYGGGAAA